MAQKPRKSRARPPVNARLLSKPRAGQALGVSHDTVERYVKAGELPVVVMPSGRQMIASDDIEAFIAKRRQVAS